VRRRLDGRPWAPLKIASGCDRRCSFCAIPAFRGSFVSRPPEEILTEAAWLAEHGVRELLLVSENSTSYGKDLGDLRLLERLLPRLARVPGLARIRISYLQPAETKPGLIDVLAGTPGVVPYFDLSFQHAAPTVLRRMRRFGGGEDFLELLDRIRELAPHAGVRSNVIVGFPGETEAELTELETFLEAARLDVVGVFGYSEEDGTEAATLAGAIDPTEVTERVSRVGALVDELVARRALERVGERVEVLVEDVDGDDGGPAGRAAHQGPEVDGVTLLRGAEHASVRSGDLLTARVVDAVGADLVAEPLSASPARGRR
jgi:MiaB/RimO family radical SAM methylthiotransferase